ncbi:guanylate kinase [Helicobacter cappadocius]|uniref:Guanylate kinase n=1 Tax=Helicobacter cappadocius TaxID=3063998 RepID=A0AA90PJR7_9HELI|nr:MULTISPECIES: guanylate kinase [unclassified Helicobacter]MDO7253364.1 guanylate kinase [Helicobacter sp. faydin-H75]MDP2539206.1 guanylate kinase [Helicobacter sp. faydin-H76]
MQNTLLVLSGPSGSGKSTLCKFLQENIPEIYFSISTTTRAPREGEKNAQHYYFVSKEEFLTDIQENKFLEWAEVHGNYYGTSILPIQLALEAGKLVIFDVDVQGHREIKKYYGNLVRSIFITTIDKKTLKQRLETRGSDSEETIKSRLMHAYNEMKHINEFDYLIINDDIEHAKEAILCIAKSLAFITNPKNSEDLCAEWMGKIS